MRIACGYLPSFALQAHARRAPHLAGRSFAVASRADHPTVLSCSRAAWEHGVRVGMPVAQARAIATELEVVVADPRLYAEAAAAVAESLLALSVPVESGPTPPGVAHHAVYLRVPTGTRGDTFGQRVLTQLARQGFRGRVGIADDRFSAFAAAVTLRGRRVTDSHDHEAAPFTQTVTCIPRGGASAFLAPLPLALLPMDPDVLDLLGRLGIRTLGEFAALPPPSLGEGWTASGVDLQALARGDGGGDVVGFVPRDQVADGIDLHGELAGGEPVLFLLRPLFDRVADRLRGRGTAADRVAIRLIGPAGETRFEVTPAQPTLSSRELVDRVRTELAGRALPGPVASIDVTVVRECDPESEELGLFTPRREGAAAQPAPFVSTARESHRRTMRGRRGKKNRRRAPADTATGSLFD